MWYSSTTRVQVLVVKVHMYNMRTEELPVEQKYSDVVFERFENNYT